MAASDILRETRKWRAYVEANLGGTGANIDPGTIEGQAARWDNTGSVWEPVGEAAFGGTRDFYLGIPVNEGKVIWVGTISNLVDERAHVGFDGSTLEFEIKNLTASSIVTIKGTDAGAVERTFLNANPNGDTLLRGDTGLRLECLSGVIEMEPGGNGFFTFNNAGILDLLGNATQSGILRITEGTSEFSTLAGTGQLWADSADERLKWTDSSDVTNILAYVSEIPGAVAPGGADTNIQYNDGGVFGGDADLVWDDTNKTLSITNTASAQPALELNVGNNPSDAIVINTSLNAEYDALVMFDQTGSNSFRINHSYNLSTPNHELNIISSQFGVLIEMENEGNIYLAGQESTSMVWLAPGTDQVRLRNNATLYIDELAAANADVTGHGQIWVRSDTPNTLMFTDDAGNDYEISTGLLPAVGGAGDTLRVNNAGTAWESTSILEINDTYVEVENIELWVSGNGAVSASGGVTDIGQPGQFVFMDVSGGIGRHGSFNWDTGLWEDVALDGLNVGINARGASSTITFTNGGVTRAQFDFVNGRFVFNDYPIYLEERAAASADVANYGQFWVRNDTPNTPMFTDDAGNDYELNAGTVTVGTAADGADSATSDTTLTDDVDLNGFVLDANQTYTFEAFIRFSTAGNGGARWAFQVAAGAVTYGVYSWLGIASDPPRLDEDSRNDTSLGTIQTITITAGEQVSIRITGTVRAGGAGATIDFQFAQNVSDASATNRDLGSYVRFTPITSV